MKKINTELFYERIQNIYSHLCDEESRLIFEKRFMYGVTGDRKFLLEMLDEIPQKRALLERAYKALGKLIIWGAGNQFEQLREICPDLQFECVVDSSEEKQKSGIDGIKVIAPEEIGAYSDYQILICTHIFHKEIYETLLGIGISEERIINWGKYIADVLDEMYFVKDIMIPCEEEVFVDCGSYDCSTSQRFIQWCNGNYKKIYAFEANPCNVPKCKKMIEEHNIKDIELIRKGVWDCKETLYTDIVGTYGSKITGEKAETEQKQKIETIKIDEVVVDDKVTFIKMDIEGAELKALIGAAKTIRKYQPKLAICVYHKMEDIVDIADYILSLSEDYHFFIRHHHYREVLFETVLYAISDK